MEGADIYNMNEAAQILYHLRRGDLEQKTAAVKQASQFVEERTYFPEAVPILITFLEQEVTQKLAEEAAWALWKFKDPRAIPVLLKKAKEGKHIALRAKTIRVLGLLEALEAIPFLLEVVSLRSEKSLVLRVAAIAALGYFKETSLISFLEKLLNERDSLIRKEAICSLGRFLRRDPKVLKLSLVKKIENRVSCKVEKSSAVRVEALTALSYSRKNSVRGLVERAALADPNPEVRRVALSLLSQWMDEKIEKFFLRSLEDLSWPIRYAAANALVQAASEKKIFDSPQVKIALQKISHTFPSHILARQEASQVLDICFSS